MSPPGAFDVTGPLPRETTMLEASAGTGKTYTIAALAARYVAEGTPLEKLLLVTFTQMATGELRERVRRRLVETEQALQDVLDGGSAPPDAVSALLASGSRAEVAARHENLRRAIAEFDAATIATTHGFCMEILAGLGVAGDVAREMTLLEDTSDLVDEVVDDLYVRRFLRLAPDRHFDRSQARTIVRAAIDNPGAPIHPEPRHGDAHLPVMRASLAKVAREVFEERKRHGALVTYDDQLTLLCQALRTEAGPAVAARLQERFAVVLVDEFQDTDPLQWEILQSAFAAPGRALVLIGDPKQAIYAFRGGDVYTYLRAAGTALDRQSLSTNWRSDQGLIDALDALFEGAPLGHPGIVYRQVRAVAAHRAPRLRGAPDGAPLRIRQVRRKDPEVGMTARARFANTEPARRHVAADLAADVVALLGSGATIDGAPVQPGDVAVLVRRHRGAELVRDALGALDVPGVITGAGSVLATEAATDWLRLLEALERPASAPRARAASLTPFVGWSAHQAATAADAEREDVHRRLHAWAQRLRTDGVASLAEEIDVSERLPQRVLGSPDGERRLTDLRHVGQLLHDAATASALGTTALTQWLRARIRAAARETVQEERSRRLESDAQAVQILTVHASKGLEFPIVYCPFEWDAHGGRDDRAPVAFHDPDDGDRRAIDVGIDGAQAERHQRQHRLEQQGEELRLAYVALTRARHQVVVWWAGTSASRNAALTRLLAPRAADGSVPPEVPVPDDPELGRALQELQARASPGSISLARASPGSSPPWSPPLAPSPPLDVARFSRPVDAGWRRTSYSDITAAAHESVVVGSEPEETLLGDEPDEEGPPEMAVAAGEVRLTPSPWDDVPGGTRVGTLVHDVLEATDFAAADLDAELARALTAAQRRRPVELGGADARLHAGLIAALATPLDGAGGSPGGVSGPLAGVARRDRLDELAFELPLAGGDVGGRGGWGSHSVRVGPRQIGALLRAHLPAGDPLAPYADRLEDPALRPELRGYLTGSVDLALRGRDGRITVVDYKTNRLAPAGVPIAAHHYRPQALAEEMLRSHYALQALLYCVAVHRLLRWRTGHEDPGDQVAGVAYLFLRGMDGTPGAGVFHFAPPPGLVGALSDLLDDGG